MYKVYFFEDSFDSLVSLLDYYRQISISTNYIENFILHPISINLGWSQEPNGRRKKQFENHNNIKCDNIIYTEETVLHPNK